MGVTSHPMRLAVASLLLGFLLGLTTSCGYVPLIGKHVDSAKVNLPRSISLCNEPIPLESPSVWENIGSRIHYSCLGQTPSHYVAKEGRTVFPLPRKKTG
jgi:hypothetical protein